MTVRKPNRLKNFDYSASAIYFVTVCTKNKTNALGRIIEGENHKNKQGIIAEYQWLWLEEHFPYVILDEFIVMPNHLHGIISIDTDYYLTKVSEKSPKAKIKSLSELVGAFKTTSSRLIHEAGFKEFSWQRSFYDRIIRNEKELNNIRQYIFYNPVKWAWDKEDFENLKL